MSIRNRIFAVFVLGIALGVYALFHWMRSDMLPRYMEAQEDLMVDMAWLLSSQIESRGIKLEEGELEIDVQALEDSFARLRDQRFHAQIYGLLKTRADLRVYVTNARGRVLFDSQPNRDLGRDLSAWRDVSYTLRGEYGARSTHGDESFPQGSTMYVAAPLRHQGEIVGVVSVGKTTRNAERFLASAIPRFALAAAIILLIALLLSLVLYLWVSLPLRRLQLYAEALQRGERIAAPALGNNEIGEVGQAMARLRRALDGKTYVEEYVQALTHELKSPTAAIAGAAELLTENLPVEDRAHFLSNIRAEAARLNELIGRMLALAEIENREALDSPTRVPVAELVQEALKSLQSQITARQVEVSRSGPAGVALYGDAFLLHRSLVNLIENALSFSSAGGQIEINWNLCPEGEGAWLQLEVRDFGPGIPGYALDKVFQRFYSLPRGGGEKGSGLGLSFVKQIVALHGGRVSLRNHPQGGALARLSLPVAN